MTTELITIDKKPSIPKHWDYDESVRTVKRVIYKWKDMTVELATELWVAREALSKPGARTDLKHGQTWGRYCNDIGIGRMTAHRLLKRYFPNLVTNVTRSISAAPIPEGVFDVICADPPWRYDFAESDNRKVENQYPTMELDEICDLKVPAADDAVLFLWATSPKLIEAIEVVNAWGFAYKTNAVWVKDRIGMGYYFRQKHELLLVATKGTLPVPDPGLRLSSVIESKRTKHSEKPDAAYRCIERMYPMATRLELFGRKNRPGWTVWINE